MFEKKTNAIAYKRIEVSENTNQVFEVSWKNIPYETMRAHKDQRA